MHESMHASIQVGKDIYFYHRLKIPISTLIVGNLKYVSPLWCEIGWRFIQNKKCIMMPNIR